NRVVVGPKRVTEPVDRDAIPALQGLACGCGLALKLSGADGGQVGVGYTFRIELPPRRQQTTNLRVAHAPLGGRETIHLEIDHRRPAEPLEHRQRVGVLRGVAVVETDYHRLAGTQRLPLTPVGWDLF